MSVTVSVIGEEMTKKRANGEGSVYKTKDGRVIGSWLDENGKTRYVTSKTMTKVEMSMAIRKKLQDRDEGIAVDSEGLTVERYMDRWLDAIRDRMRPGYVQALRGHRKAAHHADVGQDQVGEAHSDAT